LKFNSFKIFKIFQEMRAHLLNTYAPAISQNIHSTTEALLKRRNKALAVAE
jgi:hypothetical protein